MRKLDKLRKLGKVYVSHNRMVRRFTVKNKTFCLNDMGDLIRFHGIPKFMTLKAFYTGPYADASASSFFSSHGGYCEVRLDYNDKVYYGRSDCSIEDTYKKRVGLNIAIGRLLKDLFKDYPDWENSWKLDS